MKLAMFSLSAARVVCSVAEWCVYPACPRPSCFGGAPVFHAHVHHVCFTRPFPTYAQFPWNSVVGTQPPTLVNRGHVQWTMSPLFSTTRQDWCQAIPQFLPACPNARPSARISRAR
ncbi:hypothetical protein PanWU01x14_033520 [Parasponia andersonii]|uniref:Secreted protein n=1 Tax=Parasponia andersonii TaxID=3476 RepID=A0A2P5DTQ6_PARAD|nr:hypothetical protein PanWU01x14_033520 [Parasponia andersonii]